MLALNMLGATPIFLNFRIRSSLQFPKKVSDKYIYNMPRLKMGVAETTT